MNLRNKYDAASRKIMQLRGNGTEKLTAIIQEYKSLEESRRDVVSTLRHIVSRDDIRDGNGVDIDLKILLHDVEPVKQTEEMTKVTQRDIPMSESNPKHLINCSNIHEIHLQTKIGHGVSKQTYKATFRGRPVAVKMVTRHQSEVKQCIERINDNHPQKDELRSKCYVFPTMKLMKEILLLEQLNHPGFVKLLGYCIRSEESETTDLTERGVVSVFELGERVVFYNIQTLTWQQRLKHAMQLMDFLNYLENSPLGSLRVRDFKEDHFLMVNNELKMIDLDDVDNLEPSCNVYVSADTQYELAKKGINNGCEFELTCSRGMCIGFNAKQNLKFMNKVFLKHLLSPFVFPRQISQDIGALLADIDSSLVSSYDVFTQLKNFQNI
ncbi:hypothetical protein ACF0H5_020818 [Mactra antiquata]